MYNLSYNSSVKRRRQWGYRKLKGLIKGKIEVKDTNNA